VSHKPKTRGVPEGRNQHYDTVLECIAAALAVNYGSEGLYVTETPQIAQGFRRMVVPVRGDLPVRPTGGSRLAGKQLMLRWQSLRYPRAPATRDIATQHGRIKPRHAVRAWHHRHEQLQYGVLPAGRIHYVVAGGLYRSSAARDRHAAGRSALLTKSAARRCFPLLRTPLTPSSRINLSSLSSFPLSTALFVRRFSVAQAFLPVQRTTHLTSTRAGKNACTTQIVEDHKIYAI
jgi:hypothetical protein